MSPEVTVLMSVYNGEQYLNEAIDSILTQTFKNFEFVIIDDASTDKTLNLLKYFAQKDTRIKIYNNHKNSGLAAALNAGLNIAQSPLVARMDVDDVSMPHRLERQLAFMSAHPEVTVCGTALEVYEKPGKYWMPPGTHEAICTKMIFESCLFHATAVYRKDDILALPQRGYDPSWSGAEDYDLWQRLGEVPSVRFASLREPLYRCRVYPQINRWEYRSKSRLLTNQIRRRYLAGLDIYPNAQEFDCHEAICDWGRVAGLPALKDCHAWIDRIDAANLERRLYSVKCLRHELSTRWANVCLRVARERPSAVVEFLRSRWAPRSKQGLYKAALMICRSAKSLWK